MLVNGVAGEAGSGPGAGPLPEGEELVFLRRQVQTLEQAVQSNRVIGTAVGLVMARHHLTRAAAFKLLVAQSQQANLKVAVIAEHLVTHAEAEQP